MASNEAIQQQVGELNAAVSVITTGIETIKSDLTTAKGEIERLKAEGVSDETLAGLTAAVDNVERVADTFKAAVDPEQETPAPEDVPGPVESPEETPEAPADETPAPTDTPSSGLEDEDFEDVPSETPTEQ